LAQSAAAVTLNKQTKTFPVAKRRRLTASVLCLGLDVPSLLAQHDPVVDGATAQAKGAMRRHLAHALIH